MLNLKLERPLAVLDIESTGVNPRMDRIIDLAIIKLFPDGRREQRTFRVNPEIPIPAETTAIHHITNADVAHAPPFRKAAAEILEILVAVLNENSQLLHTEPNQREVIWQTFCTSLYALVQERHGWCTLNDFRERIDQLFRQAWLMRAQRSK